MGNLLSISSIPVTVGLCCNFQRICRMMFENDRAQTGLRMFNEMAYKMAESWKGPAKTHLLLPAPPMLQLFCSSYSCGCPQDDHRSSFMSCQIFLNAFLYFGIGLLHRLAFQGMASSRIRTGNSSLQCQLCLAGCALGRQGSQ